MANTTKTKWKNSDLLLNALQSDVQLCNSRYMRRSFSLKCSWDSENCSHGNNVFVMAEKGKRGEREKKKREMGS